MSLQGWGETLISSQVDGTALTNTVTAAALQPPAARLVLPANFFSIGKVLRLNAWGRISALASAALTLDVRFNTSTVVFNGGSMTLNATATTNVTWRVIMMLTCRSIGNGTSTTLLGTGDFCSQAAIGVGANTYANDMMLPASSPVVGTGFDCTVAQTVDMFGTWGAASASNSITVHQYTIEAMN